MNDIPRGMSSTPLASPPPHDPDLLRLIDAQLERVAVDAAVMERLYAPAAVAARQRLADKRRSADWADLGRYRAANAAVRGPDVVMIGDSLTEIWGRAMPSLFDDRIVNRGIAGQTSPQLLLRFMADVVDLAPRAVHILCGTNDIAGNTGPTTPEDFQRTIRAMIDLATAAGITVLLAAIPPAATIFWQPEARPREWVPVLNRGLRTIAAERGLHFIDYASALDDGTGALRQPYSADGVHVTRAAYAVMTGMLNEALVAVGYRGAVGL